MVSRPGFASGRPEPVRYRSAVLDIKCLGIRGNTVGTVICSEVLEHVDQDGPAIEELQRVLRAVAGDDMELALRNVPALPGKVSLFVRGTDGDDTIAVRPVGTSRTSYVITRNGTAADFTGSFVNLDVGSNIVSFTITGSSFSVSATGKFKTTYL